MEEKTVNNRIQKMIEELCPDGVEYRKIGDVCTIRNGYTPSKKHMEYWEDGTVPWFRMDDIGTHGRVLSDSLQHVTPQAVKGQLFQADSLIFATTATIGEHAIISVPFLCNQRFTVLTIRDEMKEAIVPMYLFHYGFIIDEWCKRNTKSGTMAAVDMNKFREIKIPVPPLQVQEEIVRILDAFTKLTAELTTELAAELAMRTKQYAYYMDKLLKLEGVEGVEYKKIGDVAVIKRGERIIKKRLKEDGRYVVISGGVNPMGRTDKNNRNANTITISSYGTAGYVNFITEDFWANDVCLCVYPCGDGIDNKFLYYALKSKQDFFYRNTTKAIPDHIPTDVIKDTVIPIPPLPVQRDIVTKLDAFSSYCTDLTSGLPAEIEARNKQYAYYRDAILQFNGK